MARATWRVLRDLDIFGDSTRQQKSWYHFAEARQNARQALGVDSLLNQEVSDSTIPLRPSQTPFRSFFSNPKAV